MSRAFPELMIWKEVVGAPRFELGTSWSRTKRATRLRYAPMRQVQGVRCQVLASNKN